MAQQRSHVPKFGNWEGDNVPYTAYFDTARKEKVGANGIMINPNDPSENPEAFKYGNPNNNNGIESEVSGPTSSLEQSAVSSEKYHGDTEGRGGQGGYRRPVNYRGGMNNKSMTTSESMSSDKSNVIDDYSVLNLPTRLDIDDDHKRSWKNPIDNNNNNNRLRSGLTNPNDDISFRSGASVPKFGAWDDQDPRSGEGFTVIFNKVKEEKQSAAAKFPPVHVQYQNTNTPQHQSKSSKRYCCLF